MKNKIRLVSTTASWLPPFSGIFILLTGCAPTSPITPMQKITAELIEYPEIETVTSQGIGETIVLKGLRTQGPAVEVLAVTQFGKQEGESSIWSCAWSVSPGIYFQTGVYASTDRADRTTTGDCFGPVNAQATLADGTTDQICRGVLPSSDICIDQDRKYFLAHGLLRKYLKQDFENLVYGNQYKNHPTNFVQEFLYNGRVGNNLRFIYREFSNNIIRPAFSQEVQYDFSESNLIGFKDVRLEVISATNTEITYKLISNFY